MPGEPDSRTGQTARKPTPARLARQPEDRKARWAGQPEGLDYRMRQTSHIRKPQTAQTNRPEEPNKYQDRKNPQGRPNLKRSNRASFTA